MQTLAGNLLGCSGLEALLRCVSQPMHWSPLRHFCLSSAAESRVLDFDPRFRVERDCFHPVLSATARGSQEFTGKAQEKRPFHSCFSRPATPPSHFEKSLMTRVVPIRRSGSSARRRPSCLIS